MAAPEPGPAAAHGPLHPELDASRLVALPFQWRWALPLLRSATRGARGDVGAGVVVDDVRIGVVDGVGARRDQRGVDRLTVRRYRPAGAASGAALLWLHGGGFMVGAPRMDDGRCGHLVRRLGVTVVSPDYRLAPEHPFPAALDDAHATWRWLLAAADELGLDPARIAVGGASAGGGLAACLVQRLVDEGGRPAAQLLLYPMLDDRTATRRELDAPPHPVWSNRSNRAGWRAYLGREPAAGEGTAAAVPAYAVAGRRASLAALPPTWIGVGDLDLFQDEDRAYAERLAAAGVTVDLHEVAGAPHGFDALAPDADVSRAFAEVQVAFLRTHLGDVADVADRRRDAVVR